MQRVCYGAMDAHSSICLTGCCPAQHLVKHTPSFISKELQSPAAKQQAFPKTGFCNTAGMKLFPESLFYQTPVNSAAASARQLPAVGACTHAFREGIRVSLGPGKYGQEDVQGYP